MRVKPGTPAWRVIKNSLVVLSPKNVDFMSVNIFDLIVTFIMQSGVTISITF
jgi:hypothetical protein